MIHGFFMLMKPPTVTQQEHQVRMVKGKPVFYEPDELRDARAKLMANLARHLPPKKYTSAVRLIVKWCFPITGKHHDGEYKYTAPDTDNLNKMLKDVMTDMGFWKDDALICSEIVEKYYSDEPGILIWIYDSMSMDLPDEGWF